MNYCQDRHHHPPNRLLSAETETETTEDTYSNSIRSGRRRRRKRLISVSFDRPRSSASSISSSVPLLILALLLVSETIPFPWRASTGNRSGAGQGHGLADALVTERRPIRSVSVASPSLASSLSLGGSSFLQPQTHSHTQGHHPRRNVACLTTRPSSSFSSSASSTTRLFADPSLVASQVPAEIAGYGLSNYAPAATSLFNNMKLPAAVVTAGMISLGFATTFPELPKKAPTTGRPYPPHLRVRCDSLRRLHIVVALISVTSELIVVMWAAVEVNQLTEKQYALASSVWDLIQRDCDLAWSAVNSHFVLGIIGFVTMLALRAYVMLLAAEASTALMTAASTGTGAALCLMISIVNRGVESGGGNGYSYGKTILDLFSHYAVLLWEGATNEVSPGPLQLSAIVLEVVSLGFMANVLLFNNGKMRYEQDDEEEEEPDAVLAAASDPRRNGTTDDDDDESCPVIEILEVANSSSPPSSSTNPNASATDATPPNNKNNKVRVVVGGAPNGQGSSGGSGEAFFDTLTNKDSTRAKVARCLAMEAEDEQATTKKNQQRQHEEEAAALENEEDEGRYDGDDTSVSSFY